MQLQFHGAVRTVTGSQHLLTVNGKKILMDCGLFQGKRFDAFEKNRNLPYDPREIDILVLSHAHIDHSGNIPNLVKNGFQGDIICTYSTRDLCAIMLRDSAKIQESDARYASKKNRRKGKPAVEPIYTDADARQSLEYFLGMAYGRQRQIMPGVYLTFIDAGHILGSATVILDIEDEEGKRDVRLVFSGDIGRPNRPILRDPETPDSADILIIESTYGNRTHKDDFVGNEELRDVINRTVRRGGKVIVPAFAVGRTQELVYRIHQMIHEDEISNELDVYVDSPLAINATSVYRLHPEAYDDELERFMLLDKEHSDPFGFDRMVYTRAVEQSKAINHSKKPAVIISASGMCEAGRILHHLKNNIQDPKNTVLIVGWQAPHTLGRLIAERRKEVKIFGEPYDLNAEVATINGLSGHADKGELITWVDRLAKPAKRTFIVHGEESASLDFAETLRNRGFGQVDVPQMHQKFNV